MSDLPDGFAHDGEPVWIEPDVVWWYRGGRTRRGQRQSLGLVADGIVRPDPVAGIHGEIQIGSVPVVSDRPTAACPCEPFAPPADRGRGLGTAPGRQIVDGTRLAGLKWILRADDAHGLHRKRGLAELGHTTTEQGL